MLTRKAAPAVAPTRAPSPVRGRIDGIDAQVPALIAGRAQVAPQAGPSKRPMKAAIDYYRPERGANALRKVLDRNDGLAPWEPGEYAAMVRMPGSYPAALS